MILMLAYIFVTGNTALAWASFSPGACWPLRWFTGNDFTTAENSSYQLLRIGARLDLTGDTCSELHHHRQTLRAGGRTDLQSRVLSVAAAEVGRCKFQTHRQQGCNSQRKERCERVTSLHLEVDGRRSEPGILR